MAVNALVALARSNRPHLHIKGHNMTNIEFHQAAVSLATNAANILGKVAEKLETGIDPMSPETKGLADYVTRELGFETTGREYALAAEAAFMTTVVVAPQMGWSAAQAYREAEKGLREVATQDQAIVDQLTAEAGAGAETAPEASAIEG